MISLGPEFAADLSAIDSAPPAAPPGAVGGTAPFADADADLFNAMLGQMMGQGEASLDAAFADDGEAIVDGDGEPTAVDPAALVNPLLVEGVTPVAIPPAATFVWTIPATTATPASISIELTAGVDESPAIDSLAPPAPAMDLPEAIDLPFNAEMSAATEKEAPSNAGPRLQAGAGQPDATPAGSAAAANAIAFAAATSTATATTTATTIATAKDTAAAAAAPAAFEPPADVVDADRPQPRSEFVQQIADAVNRNERPSRSPKGEKAPVEPKIDADAIRPVPFTAVERAYAGNDQDASRSFDAPKEQAHAASTTPPATSSPAAMPAFVVPTEGRSMLTAPAMATLDAVEIPAAMARDIDTHVPAQIVQSIRLQAINGGGEAVIRLNPGYLGEVVVAVKVEQGNVTAALQAETPAVRQWAERNESVLRQALAEQGLQLDRLTIAEKGSETETEREAGHDAREDAREQEQQQPRRRRPQSGEATFEVTV